MRRTVVIVGSVAAATVGLAGCGGSGGHATSGAHGGSSSSPIRAVQAAYEKTTAAKTAKFDLTEALNAQGGTTRFTGRGAMRFANPPSMTMSGTANGRTIRVRLVNGTEYVRLAPGERWLSVELGQLGQGGTNQGLVNGGEVTQSLAYLRGVSSKVTKVGTDTVRGTQTTEYKATIDLAKVAARQSNQAAKRSVGRLEQLVGRRLPVQVWLDEQGRLRQERVSTPVTINGQHLTSTLVLDLYDFGTPVHVSAPPKTQTTPLRAPANGGVRGGH